MDELKSRIENKCISLIIDESPDIKKRPTINYLISYFDDITKEKNIVQIDVAYPGQINSTIILSGASSALSLIDKSSSDVIPAGSDSAAYMKKSVRDANELCNQKIYHLSDVSHLINNAVDAATETDGFVDLRRFVMSTGSTTNRSYSISNLLANLSEEHGFRGQLPKKVVEHRWWAFLLAAKGIKLLWDMIMSFLISDPVNQSSPFNDIKDIYDTLAKRNLLFIKLCFYIEKVEPIESLQKKFWKPKLLSVIPSTNYFKDWTHVLISNMILEQKLQPN